MSKAFDEIMATIDDLSGRLDRIIESYDEPGAMVLERVRKAEQKRDDADHGKVVRLFDRFDERTQLSIAAEATARELTPPQQVPNPNHADLKGTTAMVNAITCHDSLAVRTLIAHWLRRVSHTDAHIVPDDPYCATGAALQSELEEAQDAGASVACTFAAGTEFGIACALAVLNDPLGVHAEDPVRGLQQALDAARKELKELVATARDDADRERRKD